MEPATSGRRQSRRHPYSRGKLRMCAVVMWLFQVVSGNTANFSVELDTDIGCNPTIAKISIKPLTDVNVTKVIITNNDGETIVNVDTTSPSGFKSLYIAEEYQRRITFEEMAPTNKGFLFTLTGVACKDSGIYQVDIKHAPDDVSIHEVSISSFKGAELKPRFYFGEELIGHLSRIDVWYSSTVLMETRRGLRADINLMMEDEKVACKESQTCAISVGSNITDGVPRVLNYHVHYTQQCVENLTGNVTLYMFLSADRGDPGITISTEWIVIIVLAAVNVISISVVFVICLGKYGNLYEIQVPCCSGIDTPWCAKNSSPGRNDTSRERMNTCHEMTDNSLEINGTSSERMDTPRERIGISRETMNSSSEMIDTCYERINGSRERIDIPAPDRNVQTSCEKRQLENPTPGPSGILFKPTSKILDKGTDDFRKTSAQISKAARRHLETAGETDQLMKTAEMNTTVI